MAPIYLSDLRSFPVALMPVTEQGEIIKQLEEQLSDIEMNMAIIEISLKRAERLRQSILKKAFPGKLVAQEAEDNSERDLNGRN